MAPKCVMIVAGEASGDLHGAKLVRAIHAENEDVFFCGIGGQALRSAGVRILIDASELAVVGFTEVVAKLPSILRGMGSAKKLLRGLRPDLVILIDFPGFNLRMASSAKRLGIPVLYYISPQVWAWRPGRVKKIRESVGHMAVILPFEEDFYRRHKIRATFVGHPLLDGPLPAIPTREDAGPDRGGRGWTIGLLPGSREGEIRRHLPVMLDAAEALSEKIGNVKYLASIAPGIDRQLVDALCAERQRAINLDLESASVERLFEKCDLAVAASGTVTLQAALACLPMVVIYKMSPLSYWLSKAMVHVEYVSLVNLIAERPIVKELIQSEASPENIAARVFEILDEPGGIRNQRKELLGVREALGSPGASERVASIALQMMGQNASSSSG